VTDAGVSTTTTTEATTDEPEFIELTYFEGTERATFSGGDADDECEDLGEDIRRCGGGGPCSIRLRHNLAEPATNPLGSC